MRFLGVDFSGGASPWSAGCGRPTVWIATLSETGSHRFVLADLVPVQALPGAGTPFDRFCALLHAGDFAAAGIDAPFSVPAAFLPAGGHAALLRAVASLPLEGRRPFPAGAALLACLRGLTAAGSAIPSPRGFKLLRDTERDVGRGLNPRSTLWNGPRGGAPFTAALLAALARAERPIWPWRAGPGMLAEAYPAAQLRRWSLPHNSYGRPDQRAARDRILAGLRTRLVFDASQHAAMRACPDALDAAVAAFGAVAAWREGVTADPPADGRIAVLDG